MACKDANGNPTPCADSGAQTKDEEDFVLMPSRESREWYNPYDNALTYDQVSPTAAKATYAAMRPDERRMLTRYFNSVGKKLGYTSKKTFWNDFVQAQINSTGSPWDLMAEQEYAYRGIKGDRKPGPYTGPVRTTTIDLSSESGARRLVDDALGQYLGRRATEDEAAKFYAALTKAQTENPSTAVVQGGQATQSAVRQEGLDSQEFAREYARSRDDFAERQTTVNVKNLIATALKQANQDRIA